MSLDVISGRMETERLILRKHICEDAHAVFEIFGDIEVMRFFGMKPILSLNAARQMIDYFERQ